MKLKPEAFEKLKQYVAGRGRPEILWSGNAKDEKFKLVKNFALFLLTKKLEHDKAVTYNSRDTTTKWSS